MSHDTYTNESRHTYEWVTSHIRMSHGTHVNEIESRGVRATICRLVNRSRHAHEWVMTHIWMRHNTRVDESVHTCDTHVWQDMCVVTRCSWVITHMRHYTRVNETWHAFKWFMSHIYEWVMSHIWMSHAAHMNESYRTYKWVLAHIWMSHVTHMTHVWRHHVTHRDESWHTYEWVTSHRWMSHETNTFWEKYGWVMTHFLRNIWMSHDTLFEKHMNESWHTFQETNGWVTSQAQISNTNASPCQISQNPALYFL